MYIEKAAETTFVRKIGTLNVDEIDTWPLSAWIVKWQNLLSGQNQQIKSIRSYLLSGAPVNETQVY